MPETLDLVQLEKLVGGDAVAIRGRAILEPAGGPADKVFPPTHSKVFPPTHSVDDRESRPGAKYAFEHRRLPGGQVEKCVLLDSVQSQANRMEEALQALWKDKQITLPVIAVDFAKSAPDIGVVTSLSAPHRVADAILRDSVIDGTLFRLSDLGRSFTDATPRNAAPLFRICPTALVFGLWDSTGPRGGLGSKFARTLVSEIVGVGVEFGTRTESRIDPVGIVSAAGPIFVASERGPDGQPTWTPNVMEAEALDPDKLPKTDADVHLVKKWGKSEKAGKPSSIVHGNVAPSVDSLAGGATIDHAQHTVVLSLAGLRKLGFAGNDLAAHTALAALALLAVLAAQSRGHDLRSRCLLVPRQGQGLRLEAVAGNGTVRELGLDLPAAIALFEAAVGRLPDGLRFVTKDGRPLGKGDVVAMLTPSEKLAELVRRSRALAAAGTDVEEA